MGWSGPGEHEGWIVPLFADGLEGEGTSSARGILVRDPATNTGKEDWRPYAAVVGWAAGCECGWRGRPWTRVVSSAQADRARRLLAADVDWADLDQIDETLIIDEWRNHIAPWQSVEAVEDASAESRAAGERLDEAVRAARRSGASWADIGRATGMTRQSANERWSRLLG